MAKPSGYSTYTFRVPNELKEALRADAERNSRSVNSHVVQILQYYLDGELIPVAKLLEEPAVRKLLQAVVLEAGKTRTRKRKSSRRKPDAAR